MEQQRQALYDQAAAVLRGNDRGQWTIPAAGLYPHQWLWDSCFIAIGLRWLDVQRAKTELLHLLSGQWSNGMIPHMLFADGDEHRRDRELWRSYLSPFAPEHIYTSGLTQPPMLAEAVVGVGQKLSSSERRSWYQTVYPALVRYHQWLYGQRDPHGEGLIVAIHPYESGLDNSPPWIHELRQHSMPWWITIVQNLRLEGLVNLFRRDTHFVPPGQRMSNIEALAYFAALRRLRRKAYDTERILSRSLFAVEDLVFNCVAIRANQHLQGIAKTINRQLPDELLASFKKAQNALDALWDGGSGYYFSRNFVTHKLIREPTIGALMPLYAGTITNERAEELVGLMKAKGHFATNYPVPSVPLHSSYFNPFKYWQGPTWLNTNWLLIDGLRRYGFEADARLLADRSLEMVGKSGCYEYFHPLSGEPAGAAGFSWTAALTLDLLHHA